MLRMPPNYFQKKMEIPLHPECRTVYCISVQQPQNQKIWPSHKTQRNRPRSYRQKPPNKRRPLKRPRSKAQPNAGLPAFYPQQHSYPLCCFFWIHAENGEIIIVATGWSPNESGVRRTPCVRSPSRLGRGFLINLGLSQSIIDAAFSLPWTCNAPADFNP
jgi:hypothetical protein